MPRNAADRKLSVQLTVDSLEAAQNLSKTSTAFENFNKVAIRVSNSTSNAMRKIGQSWNAIAVGKQAFGYLAGAIAPTVALEAAATRLAVATNKSGAELELLKRASADAAAATAFSPTEAIDGMQQLALSMTDATSASKAILPVLSLAQTYFDKNVGVAVGHVSSLLRSFSLQGAEAERTLNEWVSVAKTAGIKVNDMAAGFKKLGGAANLANTGFSEMVPLYALAVKGGIPARESATGLFVAMQNLARPTAQDELRKTFGVISSASGMMKDPRQVFLDLAGAIDTVGGVTDEQKDSLRKVFGSRALLPVIRILSQLNQGFYVQGKGMVAGAKAFDAFSEAAMRDTNILKEQADLALDPLASKVEQLQEKLNLLSTTVFTPLLGSMKTVVSGVMGVVEGFDMWLRSNSSAAAAILTLVSGLGRTFLILATVKTGFVVLTGVLGVARAALLYTGSVISALSMVQTRAAFTNYQAAYSAQMAALAYSRLGVTLTVVSGGWYGVALAAKVAARAMLTALGWIGMIVTGVLLLKDVLDALGITIFGKKKSPFGDVSGKKGETSTGTMNKFMAATDKFGQSSENFGDAVGTWKDTMKQKLPQPSSSVLGQAEGAIRDFLGGAGGKMMGEKGRERIMADIAEAQRVDKIRRDALRTGRMPTAEETKSASNAIQNVTTFLSQFPQLKGLTEKLGTTGGEYQSATENKAVASVMNRYQYLYGNVAVARAEAADMEIAQKQALIVATAQQTTLAQQQLNATIANIPAQEKYVALLREQAEAVRAIVTPETPLEKMWTFGNAITAGMGDYMGLDLVGGKQPERMTDLFGTRDRLSRAEADLEKQKALKTQLESRITKSSELIGKTRGGLATATATKAKATQDIYESTQTGGVVGDIGTVATTFTLLGMTAMETADAAIKLYRQIGREQGSNFPEPAVPPSVPQTPVAPSKTYKQSIIKPEIKIYFDDQQYMTMAKKVITKSGYTNPYPAGPNK